VLVERAGRNQKKPHVTDFNLKFSAPVSHHRVAMTRRLNSCASFSLVVISCAILALSAAGLDEAESCSPDW